MDDALLADPSPDRGEGDPTVALLIQVRDELRGLRADLAPKDTSAAGLPEVDGR